MTPHLRLVNVSKSFETASGGTFEALSAVSLDVNEGEFISFLGSSGCGKTTLLHLLAGLTQLSAGEIEFRGHASNGVNTSMAYLTQIDTLLPWRTVLGNVLLPLEVRNSPKGQRADLASRYIDLVGLHGFESYYPAQLSGGMKKRASLARTLVYGAETLLMDEPFAALDAQLRLEMQAELLRIWGTERKTVIFVTHDISEAITLSDRVVMFGSRPGHIRQIYEIGFDRPRDPLALRFDSAFVNLEFEMWHQLDKSRQDA